MPHVVRPFVGMQAAAAPGPHVLLGRIVRRFVYESGVVDGHVFWDLVAQSLREFGDDHPDLADVLRRRDLHVADFGAIHLNRLQMTNARRMVDLGDSYASLLDDDHRLANPLADPRRAP